MYPSVDRCTMSSQKGEKCTRQKEHLLEASSRCDKVTQHFSNELVEISMVCIKVHTITMYILGAVC